MLLSARKKTLSSSQRFIEKMLEASSEMVGTLSSQDKGEKKIILKFVFVSYQEVGGSEGKESACNTGDLGLIPGFGRSPGGGQGNPL